LQNEIADSERMAANLLRYNRLYAVLGATNQAIIHASNHDSLFREFCRIAVEQGGFLLSWVGLLNEESSLVRIVASCGAVGYLEDIRISTNEGPVGPTGIAIREGTYYICNDFQKDPITQPWHEKGRKYGIKASAAVALKEDGRVIGGLTIYADEKDFFDREQEGLLVQMGENISFALENMVREANRKKAEQSLHEETLVRLRAVEALREKDQMLVRQSSRAALGEMINNIAHQWRQPLNVIALIIQSVQLRYES
jgi:GAF domain-containing protein